MSATLARAMQAAEQHSRDAVAGQDDLFGGTATSVDGGESFEDSPEWSEHERLTGEKETLGVYLTGHPISRFEPELSEITSGRLDSLDSIVGRTVVVAGLVVGLRVTNSRKGRMAIVSLDDPERTRGCGGLRRSLSAFPGVAGEGPPGGPGRRSHHRRLERRTLDCGGKSLRPGNRRGRPGQSGLPYAWTMPGWTADCCARLPPRCATRRAGRRPVCIDYCRRDARVRMPLGDRWCVRPTDELLTHLEELAGRDRVSLEYQ